MRARLLQLAKASAQSFDLILMRFALERLLFRPSQSPHAGRFPCVTIVNDLLFDQIGDVELTEPAASKAELTIDTERQGADFEVNRRLSQHLVANAIRPGEGASRSNLLPAGSWRALLGLLPLLIAAWLYSLLFDKAER